MDKIRILIVDDHPIIREGLPPLLHSQSDLQVVGTAENGEKGLEILGELKPDVVILDLSMPQMGGLEALRVYSERLPTAGVVIFSMHDKETLVHQALKAGARGSVLKGSPIPELVEAIRTVARGEYALSSRVRTHVIDSYLKNRREEKDELADFHGLSDREQQVFSLLVEGKSTAQIGDLLGISPKTVENHRINVMKKLKANNVVDLVKYAVRTSLVDPEQWKI
ncbi:MAG: response regulator transcription factor [Desulfuromonadales bacterium]